MEEKQFQIVNIYLKQHFHSK